MIISLSRYKISVKMLFSLFFRGSHFVVFFFVLHPLLPSFIHFEYFAMVIFNGNFFQLGYLNVTIPPDILNDDIGFSDGHQAQEGGTIYLRCRATGEPEPEVSWKREDGKPIVIRSDKQIGKSVR